MIMLSWLRGPEGRCTVWAIAVISVFLFFSFSIDPLPVRTGEYKQDNGGEQSAKNKGDDVPHTQSADDRIATYTLWLAIFTAVLSISTIALFGITWRASSRQSEDMANVLKVAREQTAAAANQARIATEQHAALKEQARATADIVSATKAANDLTSRIFFAEQRPWVNIQGISISPTANGQCEFDVVVSNTGGSPAHFVRVSVLNMNEGDRTDEVINRELAKNKAVRRATSITVFPHERRSYPVYLHIKIDDLLMRPFVVVVEYEFAAARTEHITGGTIFCTQNGGKITYQRTPLSDFAT